MCPVLTDEPIDPAMGVEHDGQQVYLCCARCRKKFLANPDLFLANLPQFAQTVDDGHDDSGHAHAIEHAQKNGPAATGKGVEHGGAAEHNHATGHGQPTGMWRVIRFLGQFHPLVVHFPIALILAAACAELLGLVTRKPQLTEAARFCITAGALGAVAAVSLGWAAGTFANYPGELASVLWRHRWLGTGTACATVATAILAHVSHRTPGAPKRAYFVLLFIVAVLVGITGHHGGTLIFGLDYYRW